jgi:hypothetical protein
MNTGRIERHHVFTRAVHCTVPLKAEYHALITRAERSWPEEVTREIGARPLRCVARLLLTIGALAEKIDALLSLRAWFKEMAYWLLGLERWLDEKFPNWESQMAPLILEREV